jgi:hypothetical protein
VRAKVRIKYADPQKPVTHLCYMSNNERS